MKRVLVLAALLVTLTACGGTDPGSNPVPTIDTPDTTSTTPLPTTTAPTSTTTTTTPPPPPPADPATEVPAEVPPPVAYTPPPAPPAPYTPPPAPPAGVYYANSSEAKAAGAAPLHRGDPGYRPALDRDDDGVACES